MVQWLRLCASTAGGTGSIPGQGTKIPQAVQPKKLHGNNFSIAKSLNNLLLIYMPKNKQNNSQSNLSSEFVVTLSPWITRLSHLQFY